MKWAWLLAPVVILGSIFVFFQREPAREPVFGSHSIALDFHKTQPNGTCNTTATGNTMSFTSTSTNVLLLVGIGVDASRSVTGVTWGGQSLTQIASVGSFGKNGYLYYLSTTTGTTNTIAVDVDLSTPNCAFWAIALTGADAADPISDFGEAAAFSATPSVTVTVDDANSWIIDYVQSDDKTLTPTSGQTKFSSTTVTDVDGDPNLGVAGGYEGPLAVGNHSATYSMTSDNWDMIAAVVRPVRHLTVSSVAASSVNADSGQLNGTIDINLDDDVVQHGFAFGTDSAMRGDSATSSLGAYSGTGSFNETESGLTEETTYFFRAYASSTSNGVKYGSILSFTTDCDAYDVDGCLETYAAGFSTFTVPADVTSLDIACWGAGGGGGILAGGGGGGAGGGAFASSTHSVSASDVIRIFVGSGGATETAGATSTASTTAPAAIVVADGGQRALDLAAGRGGLASLSTGTVKADGGDGGAGNTTNDVSGGGGGAGGPHGAGNDGTARVGADTTGGAGGSGDAGSGGSAGTADTNNATTPGGGPGGTSTNGGGGGGGGDDGDPGGDGGSRGGGGGGGEVTGSGTEGGQGADGACTIQYFASAAAPGGAAPKDPGIIFFYTDEAAFLRREDLA